MEKVKKIGVRYILAWIFGVLVILSGAGYLTMGILAGLIILLAGVIILPPFADFVEKKFSIRLSGWLLFVVFLILLGIGGSLVQSDKQKTTNLPTSPQVTVDKSTETKAPTEEATETPKTEESVVVEKIEPEKKPELEIVSYHDTKKTVSWGTTYVTIIGEVKNNGNDKADFVKVTAKFYKDDRIVAREYSYVDNYDIPAGETEVFEIMASFDKGQSYDRYELSID